MEKTIFSTHPIAKAVIEGSAPRQARMAAAKGVLPIPQAALLEILAHLAKDEDAELASTARETFVAQESTLLEVINSEEIAPSVLAFAAETDSFDRSVYEFVLTNVNTPDEAIVAFAANATDGSLLELATHNHQRLIRTPALLDAILANPNRTFEAEQRAKQTREEFFEKERGAQQIADELRARGQEAAAQFVEQADIANELADEPTDGKLTVDDLFLLAQHIEVPDDEVDDSWLAFELIEQLYEETDEQRQALVERIISESVLDGESAPDRISLIRRIMLMKTKDRVKLALKGDREARSILIRDSNKIVAKGVLANPRITEQEIEKIAAMRTAADEVLRTIGNNRAWTRNYGVIHNLARNPRTPLPTSMNILPRIQAKDLLAISKNRNISEGIRRQADRLLSTRK